jgi:hypothetical protein
MNKWKMGNKEYPELKDICELLGIKRKQTKILRDKGIIKWIGPKFELHKPIV